MKKKHFKKFSNVFRAIILTLAMLVTTFQLPVHVSAAGEQQHAMFFTIPTINNAKIIDGTVYIGTADGNKGNKYDDYQIIKYDGSIQNFPDMNQWVPEGGLNRFGVYVKAGSTTVYVNINAVDEHGYSYKYGYLTSQAEWDLTNNTWKVGNAGVQNNLTDKGMFTEIMADSTDFTNNAQVLSGKVTDKATKAAIADANVSYNSQSAKTGPDGSYSLIAGKLDNSSKILSVAKDGYEIVDQDVTRGVSNSNLNVELVEDSFNATIKFNDVYGKGSFKIDGKDVTPENPTVKVKKNKTAFVEFIPEDKYYIADYTIDGVETKSNSANKIKVSVDFTKDKSFSATFLTTGEEPDLDKDRTQPGNLKWTVGAGRGITYQASRSFDFTASINDLALDHRFGKSWVYGAELLENPTMYMNLQRQVASEAYGEEIKQIGSPAKLQDLGQFSDVETWPTKDTVLATKEANYGISYDDIIPATYVQTIYADYYTAGSVCANHWYHVDNIKFHKDALTRSFVVYKDTMTAGMAKGEYRYGDPITNPIVTSTTNKDDITPKATYKYYTVDANGKETLINNGLEGVKAVGKYRAYVSYEGDTIVANYDESNDYNNLEKGTYKPIAVDFEIKPAKLAPVAVYGAAPGEHQYSISPVEPDPTYTGIGIQPSVTVRVNLYGNIVTLTKDDFTIEYDTNINAGDKTAIRTITITNPSYVTMDEKTIVDTHKFTINPYEFSFNKDKTVPTEDGELTINKLKNCVYNGKAFTQDSVVTVMLNGKMIILNPDEYKVEFKNNTAVGTATRLITLLNPNYKATNAISDTFEIERLPLKIVAGTPEKEGDLSITGIKDSFIYNGTARTQDDVKLTAMVGGDVVTLRKGIDFEIVNYKGNKDAGTASFEIKINSPYVFGMDETIKETFTITPLDIVVTDKAVADLDKDGEMSISKIGNYVYNGEKHEPVATVNVLVNGDPVTLDEGTDFEVVYKNNVAAGTAARTIKMMNKNYVMNDYTEFFKIAPLELTFVNADKPEKEGQMTISPVKDMDYTGQALTQNAVVKVMVGGKVVTLDANEFEVIYKDNIAAGTAQRQIKIVNPNFILGTDGTYTQNFMINKVNVAQTDKKEPTSEGEFTVSATKDMIFNGTPITQVTELKMMLGGKVVTLREGTDFEVLYEENVKTGIATRTIHFKNPSLVGKDIVDTFKIAPKSIMEENGKPSGDITIDGFKDNVAFNGNAITQDGVKFYANGKLLVEGVDYDVTYSKNDQIGKATVTYTFKGDYTGVITKTFDITNPNATTGTSTSTSTGDATDMAGIMLMMSAAGACMLGMKKRRNKNAK